MPHTWKTFGEKRPQTVALLDAFICAYVSSSASVCSDFMALYKCYYYYYYVLRIS